MKFSLAKIPIPIIFFPNQYDFDDNNKNVLIYPLFIVVRNPEIYAIELFLKETYFHCQTIFESIVSIGL